MAYLPSPGESQTKDPTIYLFIYLFVVKSYTEYTHKKHTKQKKSKSIKADMPANASKSINC